MNILSIIFFHENIYSLVYLVCWDFVGDPLFGQSTNFYPKIDLKAPLFILKGGKKSFAFFIIFEVRMKTKL